MIDSYPRLLHYCCKLHSCW